MIKIKAAFQWAIVYFCRVTFSGFYKLLASENGGDALRNTLATILPGLILACLAPLDVVIAISVGALLTTLTDMPGSRADKWLSARWCVPAFFLVSFITAYLLHQEVFLIAWLMVAAFAGGMSLSLGPRIALVGILSLILISFTIGLWPVNAWLYSIYVACGSVWYFSISLLLVYLRPYRSLKHALNNSYEGMARLLKAKAQFYDAGISLEKAYEGLSGLHITVSEQQDQVRALLLREADLLQKDNRKGQQWLHQLYGMIDLYEVLTAIDHDYDTIRHSLATIEALEPVRKIILQLAEILLLVTGKGSVDSGMLKRQEIEALLNQLTSLNDGATGHSSEVLAATVANIREILTKVDSVSRPAVAVRSEKELEDTIEYSHFIPTASVSWSLLVGHFKEKSDFFRFAIRWALLFGAGGLVGFILPDFKYTYWVLLTIAIVARPTFAVTQRRNYQRLMGTVIGLLICLPLIYFVGTTWLLLMLAILALYGFFLFNQPNYTVSVLFITVTAVILLNVYHGSVAELLGSRAAFTLLGAVLAVLGWFLIPVKQSRQLSHLEELVIQTNQFYLGVIESYIKHQKVNSQEIRLARKKAHEALAAFSNALSQLRAEPGNKKRNWERELRFQSLAYRANSLVVGIALSLTGKRQTAEAVAKMPPRIRYVKSLFRALKDLQTDGASPPVK